MQIQVNTDYNIAGRETLVARVQEDVEQGLSRFAQQVTRIEVHLSDENAAKPGDNDKRCLMEARPSGQKPVAVTHMAATLPEAWAGAIKKLRALLDTQLGKLNEKKGAESIRDNELR
ncbi:ribosomal subunit interface protein [Roseococcus thiosulfatophilus]|uniref:ribosomal subunit interface protein n=1 Tax=Roseococcus thiosulfatophilus TaxID=35813 RepID=UPI001A8C7DD2|nr:ribosomal subunit interface protein [Roseococcus thiosulfatophilus]